MGKRLITEQDVREYAGQQPIYVTADVILTPAAADAAMSRGITVIYQREAGAAPDAPPGPLSPRPPAPLVPREDRPEAFAAARPLGSPIPSSGNSPIMVQLPAGKDRTYVVKVAGDGVRVFESGDEGLRPV
ncbi:MAG: hypothetical protein HZA54_15710 [Planctomycetes bacterium]|nr:hypothetical protein [Planctomycetota bacterium]